MPDVGCVEGVGGDATGAVELAGLRGCETTRRAGACCLRGVAAAGAEDLELAEVGAAAGAPTGLLVGLGWPPWGAEDGREDGLRGAAACADARARRFALWLEAPVVLAGACGVAAAGLELDFAVEPPHPARTSAPTSAAAATALAGRPPAVPRARRWKRFGAACMLT